MEHARKQEASEAIFIYTHLNNYVTDLGLFALATWSGEKQRKALAATGEQTIPKERHGRTHGETHY